MELNDVATAERIAEGLRPAIIVKPAPTRWLDLALVIDAASSMAIWRQTIIELRTLLARLGAFRDIRVYQLATDEGVELHLSAGAPGGVRRSTSPRALVDPLGRRLILVVSDCVARAWDDGRMGELITQWGGHGPVAIVQVLPQRLWQRSGLAAAENVRLAAPGRRVRNVDLSVERNLWDLALGKEELATIALPVMELGDASLGSWARMLAGSGDARSTGVMLPVATGRTLACPADACAKVDPEVTEPTAEQRVQRFYGVAAPEAFKLAALFAAAPLSLPVMRLIREVMLPQATLGHVAEVFLGGLLRHFDDGDEEVDPEYVRYDFFEGVREQLLNSASAEEATTVLGCVSEYVVKHLGGSLDFRVLLADPTAAFGGASIRAADRPFAEIGSAVLRRLGGAYVALAVRIEQSVAPPPPAPSTVERLSMQFDAYAREFENIREQLPPGTARTFAMTELVDKVSFAVRVPGSMAEWLTARFIRGDEGGRLAVLAVLLKNPHPHAFELVRLGIAESRSPFEQYTALRVAFEMVPVLAPEQVDVLRRTLVHERSGSEGTWIAQRDPSRWALSGQILKAIERLRQPILPTDLGSQRALGEPVLDERRRTYQEVDLEDLVLREVGMDCMGFRIVGNVHIIVVGEKNPTAADWNAYAQAILAEEKNGLSVVTQMRTLVFTDGGGPNAAQRKTAADALNGRSSPVAIVTNSVIMRAVMKALRLINPQANAFAPSELSDAMAFLQIPEREQETMLKIARDLIVALRIPAVKSLETARLRSSSVPSTSRERVQ